MVERYDVVVAGGGLVGTATAYELGPPGRPGAALRPGRPGAGDRRRRGDPVARHDRARRPRVGRAVPPRRRALRHADPEPGAATPVGRAAASSSSRRATATCRRSSGPRRGHRPRPRSLPTKRTRWCRCLGDVKRALWHAGAARVDGRKLASALRAAATDLGVEVRTARSTTCAARRRDRRRCRDRNRRGGHRGWRLVTRARRPTRCRSCRSIRCAGRSCTSVSTDTTPARGRSCSRCSATTWFRGPITRVAVGATVEEAGFDPAVTAGGVHEVLRETLRVMPGLARATLREVRVGLRPVSVDDTPIIGRAPRSRQRDRRNRPRRQRAAARPGHRRKSSPTSAPARHRTSTSRRSPGPFQLKVPISARA